MSKYDKFHTKNFLKEKIFTGTENASVSRGEISFIREVLEKSSFKGDIKELINSINLIDSNFEYDSYSFQNDKKLYVIKVNEDDPDNILEREFKNLSTLEKKPVSPLPVFFEKVDYSGSEVNVLVITLERSLSLFDTSEREFFALFEPLAMNFSFLHEFTQDKRENEAKAFIENLLADNDFEEIVPKEVLQKYSTKIPNYPKYKELLSTLKKETKQEFEALEQSDFCLCHTNLTKSRILVKDRFFKFINFQYSYFLDPFFDIALLVLSTGICKTEVWEKEFLGKYLKHHRKLDITIEDAEEKLNKFKNVCYKIILLRLSSEMIYEFSMHGNNRANRILKIIKRYEYIRPLINERIPQYVSVIDDFFYLFK